MRKRFNWWIVIGLAWALAMAVAAYLWGVGE